VDLLEAPVVAAYVDDLKAFLSKDSIVEQKSFLRFFVKRIEANLPQVVITYTVPLKTQKVEPLEREVLPFAYAGSPSKLKGRTFRAVFHLPLVEKAQKVNIQRLARTYRNPLVVAQEWQETLRSGTYSSAADLARKLRISRARVTQVLSLLRLPPDVLNAMAALGDPLPFPILTERRLRAIMNLSMEEQAPEIRKLLARRRPNTWTLV
jgi:hypothetical protein